jgi:hypothetical protein
VTLGTGVGDENHFVIREALGSPKEWSGLPWMPFSPSLYPARSSSEDLADAALLRLAEIDIFQAVFMTLKVSTTGLLRREFLEANDVRLVATAFHMRRPRSVAIFASVSHLFQQPDMRCPLEMFG